MCGRFMLQSPIDAIAAMFHLDQRPNLRPRYNIAPTQESVIVRLRTAEDDSDGTGGDAAPETARTLEMARFGLVPFWADDPKVGCKMINARAETVHRLPSFRDAFRKRRCLIPADGFFEWQVQGEGDARARTRPGGSSTVHPCRIHA